MTAPVADELPPDPGWPPADVALDLARQMIAEWRAIGAAATRAGKSDDPTARLRLEISGAGKQQAEAAQLAARFALVSIAEDLHAIRRVLIGHAEQLDAQLDVEQPPGEGTDPDEHL